MYDKLIELENLLKNNNVNEALIKINLLKEELNPSKETINQDITKEDVDKKIAELQQKDVLNEPVVFEFLKENYDKYIASEERVKRLNSLNLENNQDIKPQTLMPDFIKKQLGNM